MVKGTYENTACRSVIGPNGKPLTLADLPREGFKHWVIKRKVEVLVGIEFGLLSLDEACKRYGLTNRELTSWQQAYKEFGLDGLSPERLRRYRGR